MKNVVLLSIFTLIFAGCFAQDSTISLSRFEQFIGQPGKVFKTENKQIGSLRSTSIDKAKATDLTTGVSFSTVRISPQYKNLNPISSLYITFEELDSVINVLDYFAREIQKGTPDEEVDYNYITYNDVKISCVYSTEGFGGWSLSIGRVYKHLRSFVANTTFSYGRRNVEDLAALFRKARE